MRKPTFWFLAACGSVFPTHAWAHHDTAVQQVGSTTTDVGSTDFEGDGPRFEARAGFTWQSFGRLQSGGDRFDDAKPAVAVERYTLSMSYRMASRTRIDLALPAGRIRGERAGAMGLGDVSAGLSQAFGPVRVGLLGTAPTGRYTMDAVSSVVDVTADDSGTPRLTTYDARASLGSGTWQVGTVASLEGRLGRFGGQLRTTLIQPLNETVDGIRWGRDVTLLAAASARLAGDQIQLGTGLLGRIHAADRIQAEPEPERTAEVLRTSRRRSLGIVTSLGIRLTGGLSCGTRAHVPLAQWVQGVQLAESFTVTASCALAREWSQASS
ncbi:MAG: hypothetical protein AAGA48_27230 [Myxococcota bacterium]